MNGERVRNRAGVPCSIDGCTTKAYVRGWCTKHYQRWRKNGDPLTTSVIVGDDRRRFWSKVERRGADDCWLWQGELSHDGYGRFPAGGRTYMAHRWAYEVSVGDVAADLTLDHLCRTRPCVNPSHMEPVTRWENVRRGNTLTAENTTKTHCSNGHPFTPENTYRPPDGSRVCRACQGVWQREYRRRKRLAPA